MRRKYWEEDIIVTRAKRKRWQTSTTWGRNVERKENEWERVRNDGKSV